MKTEFKKYYFIVISNKIVRNLGRFVSLEDKAMALTLYPFIFVRKDTRNNKEIIRHEVIHIRQQIELLIIGALLLYIFEYLYAKYVKKLDRRQVYYFSALEQEAHRNSANEHYLTTRAPYAVFRYIKDKKRLSWGRQGELVEDEY